MVAHVALRLLLGALLDRVPQDLVMTRDACPECGGPSGRPVLAGGGAHFSLSHSRHAVLVACASTPVGVDVEAVPVAEAVAQRETFFHSDEVTALDALPRPGALRRSHARGHVRRLI